MKKREFLKLSLMGAGAMAVHQKVNALEYYPRLADKSWAVIYATWCGSSRDAAVWISEGMGGIANVFDIREHPDTELYDNLVIGASIRGGKVSGEMQEFLNQNKEKLSHKVRGHFVVCGNMMQAPTPKQTTDLIDNHLALLTGAGGVPSRVLLGRVTYGLLDEDSAKLLKGFNMPEYDNLKRSECMAFGKVILNG
jgi:hypothetical protein